MKIVVGMCDDWDLVNRYGVIVVYWSREHERTFIVGSIPAKFAHLDKQPATEAHGLMILNALKAQLENGNE